MAEQDRYHSLAAQREEFLTSCIAPHVTNPLVLEAFRTVDRWRFAPPRLRAHAYTDRIIPLGPDSTISQPSLVAEMVDALDLSGQERVLQIGTGSGYLDAVLRECSSQVHTVESNRLLGQQARYRLRRLGYSDVHVHLGDGALGVPSAAPFDRILVTAGARYIPDALVTQLAEEGVIVTPVAPYDLSDMHLVQARKVFGEVREITIKQNVFFVPLKSDAPGGWSEAALAQMVRAKMRKLEKIVSAQGMTAEQFKEMCQKKNWWDYVWDFMLVINRKEFEEAKE